jgi:hypothetical protein
MDTIQKLADLYVLMYDELPGIDTYTLDQHLQQACRKFADDTEAFRETLAAIDIVAEQVDYTLTPSWDCRIKKILGVWLRSSTDVTNDDEGVQQAEDYYKFVRPNTLTLADDIEPTTAVTDGLIVEVVLVPEITQSGTNVVSIEFLNDYAEAIMSRAFYTLEMMRGRKWTDIQRADKFHGPNYLTAVTDAMADITLANKTQPDGFEG